MKKLTLVFLPCLLFLAACQKQTVVDSSPDLSQRMVKVDMLTPRSTFSSIEEWGESINQSLAASGIQLEKMEYLSAQEAGNIVLFKNVGNKQLTSDYVPNDPRNGTGADVPYVVDGTELGTASGMTPLATLNAIDGAMSTWGDVTCSGGLNIPNLGVAPFDIGYVQFLLGAGGVNGFFPGIIAHCGILPASFFELLQPGGGSGIIGVTFTFTYVDDLDQDGKGDVAIKEIYYNDGFNFQDAPNAGIFDNFIDFETIVLHEVGHGLSQQHFGKLSVNSSNGKIKFSPFALMNAGYTQARREVIKTDNAGHCSLWASWPQQ